MSYQSRKSVFTLNKDCLRRPTWPEILPENGVGLCGPTARQTHFCHRAGKNQRSAVKFCKGAKMVGRCGAEVGFEVTDGSEWVTDGAETDTDRL